MNEEEWLACENPTSMQPIWRHFLLGRFSDRKVRLFACACCRCIWDSFPDPRNRALVVVVEDNPDANCNDPTLSAAIRASSAREREFADHSAYWAAKYLGRSFYKMPATFGALGVALRSKVGNAVLVALLRDIFGNPFRPVALDPAWLTSDVVALAQGIYDGRAFDRMPILADALQDAGCANDDILNHCRAESVHVRGCWVVDLLLGKS